ncbi:MAG: DegV family protein [Lawsonibacter sp.]|nr:DegV family protein [Lawsonibacter sp.]
MARIKFTTDSAADISPAAQQELDIQVLPFPIILGERELADGVDFTPDDFYEMLLAAPSIPTHAQLNPYAFTQCFEEAQEAGYDALIHTSINSKGSATFQNALQAREDFYEDHPEAREAFPIHIIDSKVYTMGYGWAVIQGARMAREGKSAPEIAAWIQDWVDHVRVIFSPLDLRFAKRSGRISAAAAFVGEALGLKPVMTFTDGESKILSKVRGEKNVVASITALCKKERRPGTPFLLIRGNNLEQAAKLEEACRQELGEAPALQFPIGGVIAINAGPNLVGLVYRT